MNHWHIIRIRQMHYNDAKNKLEREIHNAQFQGHRYVEIIHGIGTYTLRNMTVEYLQTLNFVKLLPEESGFNPGSLKVELDIPDEQIRRKYLL